MASPYTVETVTEFNLVKAPLDEIAHETTAGTSGGA